MSSECSKVTEGAYVACSSLSFLRSEVASLRVLLILFLLKFRLTRGDFEPVGDWNGDGSSLLMQLALLNQLNSICTKSVSN